MLAEQGIVDDTVAGEILPPPSTTWRRRATTRAPGRRGRSRGDRDGGHRPNRLDGGRMHTARSRNDEVATCIRYRLREDLLAAAEATIALRREALVDRCRERAHGDGDARLHAPPAGPADDGRALPAVVRGRGRPRHRAPARRVRPGQPVAARCGRVRGGRRSISTAIGLPSCSGSTGPFATRRTRRPPATSSRRARPRARRSRRRCRGLAEDLILFSNKGFRGAVGRVLLHVLDHAPEEEPGHAGADSRRRRRRDRRGDGHAEPPQRGPRAYNRDLQRAHAGVFEIADDVREATGSPRRRPPRTGTR